LKAKGTIQFAVELEIATSQPRYRLTATTADGFAVTGDGHMAYTLASDKIVDVAVTYLDAKGNEVDVATGSVKWETSNETIATVAPRAGDDQTATITPGIDLGTAQITCTATNPDGSQVIATMDVNVVAGNAVTGVIAPVEAQPTAGAKK
jgi:hypothetical protein